MKCRDCDDERPCERCAYFWAYGPHSHHNPYSVPYPPDPVTSVCRACGKVWEFDPRLRLYPCGHERRQSSFRCQCPSCVRWRCSSVLPSRA